MADPTTLTNSRTLPIWSRARAIGDYDGSTDKRDSETEGTTPYAASVYTMIQGMRGSAFTQQTGTLVHVENLAMARFWATLSYRYPEKIRANATPQGSDEKLDYWVKVCGIPVKETDQRWQIRERAAAHYRASNGNSFPEVERACSDLLGSAFVGLNVFTGTALENPPDITYWPGVNPAGGGDALFSLGHGAWLSSRAHVQVIITEEAANDPEKRDLVNVQLFQLLDRMLPAKCTFRVVTAATAISTTADYAFAGI